MSTRFAPARAELPAPWRWRTEEGARKLLGDGAQVGVQLITFDQRFASLEQAAALFGGSSGPGWRPTRRRGGAAGRGGRRDPGVGGGIRPRDGRHVRDRRPRRGRGGPG